MNLNELLALPKSGVVILIRGSTVLVSYTTSMGAELEELYNQFKGQSGIEMKVFSAGADLETLRLHTEYYRRHYHDRLCYKPLVPYSRKAVQYKVRLKPAYGFKFMDVELVNARGDSKFVGRFTTIQDAKDFVSSYYGADNLFMFPVFAVNADTRAFLHEINKKTLDVK